MQQVPPVAFGASNQAPWAHWNRPVERAGQPFAEAPTAPLPPTDASGRFVGYQPGWTVAIHPLSLNATMDTNVNASVLTAFTLDQPAIPLPRIVDAAPPTGLFAGITEAFFVVQTPGIYAFSVRVTRSGTESANCLVRLASAKHRMVSNLALNTSGQAVLNYVPTEFRLQPGLFAVSIGVGCWRGDHMAGPGEVSLMVRHPGETALKPAAADELLLRIAKPPGAGATR
jgi:hypothetical protein